MESNENELTIDKLEEMFRRIKERWQPPVYYGESEYFPSDMDPPYVLYRDGDDWIVFLHTKDLKAFLEAVPWAQDLRTRNTFPQGRGS